jgi:D-beta-D-heptose 7-phosphate kinase / D-beta-D-heptose 1-phosphate adenosyltransferase
MTVQAYLDRAIESFAGLRVLVLGEAILDEYLYGEARRLAPDAPVPVLDVHRRVDAAGGAANAALNVRTLGGVTTYLSILGADHEGTTLKGLLAEQGIDTTDLLQCSGRRTLVKRRLVAGDQLIARFDEGTTRQIDAGLEALLLDRLRRLFPVHDVVLVSDYDYGLLTPRLVAALADLQACCPKVLVLDSKRLGVFSRVGATAVKPNFRQAQELLGSADGHGDRVEQIVAGAPRILSATGAQIAAVTLDCDGAVILERDQPPHHLRAPRAGRAMTSGAGDTFVAALALSLAALLPATSAGEVAVAAAALVVAREGTATCTAVELRAALAAPDKYVPDRGVLCTRLDQLRRQGARIVLTNGCFDVLHRGHAAYLQAARGLGDVLVVGVNDDQSVRRLKGSARPVNPLEDRVALLAALGCVDFVTCFSEDTPEALVRALRPHVFAKGGDYTVEDLPEAPAVQAGGGEVQILPFFEDRSTTLLIERIRSDSRPRFEQAPA